MKIGTVTETFPGERRVALVPGVLPALKKAGLDVCIQAGAGREAGFDDESYRAAGAEVLERREQVFESAEVICQVRTLGANPQAGRDDLQRVRSGQTLIGLSEPFTDSEPILALAGAGVQTIALELMPRITRAQSMDVLSSQATIAGYKASLMAADALPRMFPMMMTAAGTLAPAKAFIIGAGVAGLQAIATTKRLGAVVLAYDVRPAVKEQVESLGARFVVLELESEGAQDKGGYAKAMDEEFYRRQRELMMKAVADNDVVITTAAVPGRKPPVLVTQEMVEAMSPGSVIVDLAAERGGNCELDPSRRAGLAPRRDDPRSDQLARHRAPARKPDVRPQRHGPPQVDHEGRRSSSGSRGRGRPRHLDHAGRRDHPAPGPEDARSGGRRGEQASGGRRWS